jgi:uncharacterized protein
VTLIYLDSSAAIKLFLDEPFSAQVAAAVRGKHVHCVTSDLTYAEIHGFLSRAAATGRITGSAQKQLVQDFRAWFESVAHCAISFTQVQRAGNSAIQHNLRGADSIHLAAALECAMPGVSIHRVFACFDERLIREMQRMGIFDEFLTFPDLS